MMAPGWLFFFFLCLQLPLSLYGFRITSAPSRVGGSPRIFTPVLDNKFRRFSAPLVSPSGNQASLLPPDSRLKNAFSKVSNQEVTIDSKSLILATVTGTTMGTFLYFLKLAIAKVERKVRSRFPFPTVVAGGLLLGLLYTAAPQLAKTDYLQRQKSKLAGPLLEISAIHALLRLFAVIISLGMGFPLGMKYGEGISVALLSSLLVLLL
jgi:hypothetical protein